MAATSDYLSCYDIDAHIARAVPVYRHKRDLMLATMSEKLSEDVHFSEADGGLFVWLTMKPWAGILVANDDRDRAQGEPVDGAPRMAAAALSRVPGVRDSPLSLCLRAWCGGAMGTLSA